MSIASSPKVAIVGRPNVGKSTLFNRIVGRRKAIVHDLPGITRDRMTAEVRIEGAPVTLVDTGGFDTTSEDVIRKGIKDQVERAIQESDLIIFVVDARTGVSGQDEEVAAILRKSGRPVLLAGNKVDAPDPDVKERMLADLHRLGFPDVFPVSAEHREGIGDLLEAVQARLGLEAKEEEEAPAVEPIKVAIIGRPNVGKSSLLNAVLGDERCLVTEVAGTTRDAVDVLFERPGGERYLFIDTAGIRKKGRVDSAPEKLSVVMAMKGLERSDAAIVVLDAKDGVSHQDAVVAGYAYESGKAVVLAANKWDLTLSDREYERSFLSSIRDQMKFLGFAPIVKVSARTGQGIDRLLGAVRKAHASAGQRVPTAELNRFSQEVLRETSPVVGGGNAPKVYYMTQTGVHPPSFTLFTNPKGRDVHFSYVRFLENQIRERYGFAGTPIRFRFVPKKPREKP